MNAETAYRRHGKHSECEFEYIPMRSFRFRWQSAEEGKWQRATCQLNRLSTQFAREKELDTHTVCGQPHRPNFTSFPPTNRGTCQHFVVISVSAVASSSPPPILPCVHPFAACVSVCLLILLSSLHSHLTAVNIRFTCD